MGNMWFDFPMRIHIKRVLLIPVILALSLSPVVVAAVIPSTSAHATPVSLPVTATHTGDIQVTSCYTPIPSCPNPPQTILTTPTATFDGGPVRVELMIEYLNQIPDPTTVSNGIFFDLYEDGLYVERLTLMGEHNITPAMTLPIFGPVYVSTILDGAPGTPPAPTAGSHVFSVKVFKWSPGADGYLRMGDNTLGLPQPGRLTITKFI